MHGILAGLQIPNISDVEFDLFRNLRHFHLVIMPHIILLLLIPGENPYLSYICFQKSI